ncbi:enoyl-CoA hydratase-related protein [Streptomyces sp. NPDC008092]|uniref:enoyl-CoA hydratase n=1 Tax=Streptomyces sp. NPDC008092 TaxID=3364808 RepID=UPI0036EA0801
MTSPSDVLIEQHDSVVRVTFNRPDRLNALTSDMLTRSAEAVEKCGDDPGTRLIVLTGSGRAFSSGADLADGDRRNDRPSARIDAANRLIRALRAVPRPVLAAVNGPAAGVGCSLALAADVAIAQESAYFLLAFANVGLMPDGGATALLPAAVGRARALSMAMLPERVPARAAVEWGLIAQAVPDGEFATESERLISRLAHGPTKAYAQTKRAINATALPQLEQALALEREGQCALFGTADHAAGVAAFEAKRMPEFLGE